MLKKVLYILFFLGFIAFPVRLPVSAETPVVKTKDIENALKAYRESTQEESKTTSLRVFGDKIIDLRIADLQQFRGILTSYQIDGITKNALTSDLDGTISGLTELKGVIDKESDIARLKTEVRSVYTDFRIFEVVLVRDHARLAAARLRMVINTVSLLEPKLDTLSAKAKGKNIPTKDFDAYIADLKEQLSLAKQHLDAADAKFILMDAKDINSSKHYFTEGETLLKEARSNLKAAREDLQKIKSLTIPTEIKQATSSAETTE